MGAVHRLHSLPHAAHLELSLLRIERGDVLHNRCANRVAMKPAEDLPPPKSR
jgi:hypothetical protein